MKSKSVLRRKEFVFESLEGEEGIYVKAKGVEEETFGFWLRFIQKHFIPCRKCQEELAKLIINAETMNLGNKEYEPAVELWRKYEIDDGAWKEIERRPSTDEEKKQFEERHLWFE